MPHGQSRGFALFASAIVAADAVLLHATVLKFFAAFWGVPLALHASSAGAAGLIGASFLTLRTDRRWLASALLVLLGGLGWVAAAVIGDWAETEGIIGARALPQWWYATHKDRWGAGGLTFFSGQAIAGTIAGLGLVPPLWFDRTCTLSTRALHAVIIVAVVALTWTAIFHARWVACGFGFVAPGTTVDITPPAAYLAVATGERDV